METSVEDGLKSDEFFLPVEDGLAAPVKDGLAAPVDGVLKIPFSELKIAYTRHLFLSEVIIKDVSLYILSILFQYKKQTAFINYNQLLYVNNNENKIKCKLLLLELEDRFINAVVSYRIGYCYED
jgi:hypothetical protein